ncbi:DUF6054 family protein [Alicyclobacillus macrosporangiidus]|uniref:DUF6054 family protein n=1 Tax=Alicyclobacillus macrosporangiidus TaxID=392015 RepID=UPI000495D134|nr:DUF6054 family protein [Alicyclobacillus macrosporangiidus]
MSELSFRVNLSPGEAYNRVREKEEADLVHEEFHDLGDGRAIGTLVFERYYFRTSNRAALVVIIDNLNGQTEVRSIAIGSSEGLFLKFDWGAASSFASTVERILKDHIQE